MKSETIFPAPVHAKTQLRTRTGERYRHELKYRISYGEKAALELRLAAFAAGRPRRAGRVSHPEPLF